jgi:hypothetical protein
MRRNNTKEGEVIENRERKARGEREKRKNNRTGGQKRGRKKGGREKMAVVDRVQQNQNHKNTNILRYIEHEIFQTFHQIAGQI